MAKENKKIIEAALEIEADDEITYNDLETFETEHVVEFLEKQLKEAKEVLEAQRAEDEEESD